MPKKRKSGEDPAAIAYELGLKMAREHPVCAAILMRCTVVRQEGSCPKDGWAVVHQRGYIYTHASRRAEPKEWAYVLAHCALHLGFGHFVPERQDDRAWQAACDVVIERFLRDIRVGEAPFKPVPLPGGNEESLYRNFRQSGVPEEVLDRGTAGTSPDMVFDGPPRDWLSGTIDYQKILAKGLTDAVEDAVEVAAGDSAGARKVYSAAEKARQWFVTSYPLLGAMAAGFKIIEDPVACRKYNVAVGAVDAGTREIFMNPAAAMDELECRFVIAHEILHVGLRHAERCAGRDPYLWNVACDYAINGWLIEMGVGVMPAFGGLYDPELKGLNAEAIYDIIVRDLRRYRKLATLRGVGLSDLLGPADGVRGPSSDLEDFYQRALAQGLVLHERSERGLLPAGLIEEIEALSAPPIPWDVKLAQWLDGFFAPLEHRRSYARPSRRQAATPEIPRPRVVPTSDEVLERTFGVVLDTSGSMDRETLARGLGSISSYALSREVPCVRLVFCDAATHDEGYVQPEAIAGRVKVRGRGGTVLQPGITLLENAKDFPKDGPILVVTDGYCDRFRVSREHAILVPPGARLPFIPRGPVFEMQSG